MDISKVAQVVIFKNLSRDELSRVMTIMRERHFKKGEMVMQEDEEGETMYMVMEGEVEISKRLTMKFGEDDFRETEKVLSRINAADHAVFGEMALISRITRSATIGAVTDCLLLEIRRDDFLRFIEEIPSLGVKVLMNISELLISRLRQSSQDVMRLTTALSIALGK